MGISAEELLSDLLARLRDTCELCLIDSVVHKVCGRPASGFEDANVYVHLLPSGATKLLEY